jgi:uncharacterized membrane protein YiaA
MESPQSRDALNRPARLAAWIGAVGSAALVLWVGRRNPSTLLMAMFVGWTMSPFIALLGAMRVAARWPRAPRVTVHALTILTTLISLGVYGGVAVSQPERPAAAFLMVPLASWVLGVVIVSVAMWRSRRAP